MPKQAGSGPGSGTLRQRQVSTAGEALVAAEEKVGRALLVLWDELPHWRRDNAFIQGGYRSESNSYAGSLLSLGYLHNEFVNIWSHLAGAVGFGLGGTFLHHVVAPRYPSASVADVFVFSCFFAGALLCLGMSAAFHALCNHSAAVATLGNKLDYTGIVLMIAGSFVPAMYYGFFCWPTLMKLYSTTICLLGVCCVAVSWLDHFRSPAWRPYRTLMFAGYGLSGVVPVMHGLAIYGYCGLNSRMGLDWVLLQGVLYITGALFYVFRWPERTSPGSFDIWGSSHQLFHIFILLAAASHLYGMCKAFDFRHTVLGATC